MSGQTASAKQSKTEKASQPAKVIRQHSIRVLRGKINRYQTCGV